MVEGSGRSMAIEKVAGSEAEEEEFALAKRTGLASSAQASSALERRAGAAKPHKGSNKSGRLSPSLTIGKDSGCHAHPRVDPQRRQEPTR